MAADSEPVDPPGNAPAGPSRGDSGGGDAGEIIAETAGDNEVPPMLPSRGVYLLAFAGVVLAGILGGIIGFGIADVGSDSDAARFVGTLLGAIIAAGGVAIVAVLVLRAMAEWRRTQ